MQFECVLDSRTAKQMAVLAEMNATGSSGEINYGKGLFYLRPCRLWSPYNPGQLPHRCLTVTSLVPHCYLTSSYYSYPFMASYCSPSQEFQVSHSVRIQLTYKYALININAISAPSDARKGIN